jgi:hypothetical protein
MQKINFQFGLKVIVALMWWVGFVGLILLVDPGLVKDVLIDDSYLPFFFFLSMALISSFWLSTQSMLKSLLLTCFSVGQVVFLLWQVWSIWFLISSFGLLIFGLWIIGAKSAKLPPRSTFTNKSEE